MSTTMREDIKTGRTDTCAYCGETIIEIQDPYSFVIDWGAEDHRHPGDPKWCDWGCSDSPETDSEGCGSHFPKSGKLE